MKHTRYLSLLLALVMLTACGGAGQPENAPTHVVEGAAVTPVQTVQPASPEQAALFALQTQFDLDADQISVLSVIEGEWPDACLGVPAADEQCAQVVTPGYVVTLEAQGALYTYNMDQTLTTVRLVAAPEME